MKIRLWLSSALLILVSVSPTFAQYWSAMGPVDPKNASYAGFSNDEKRVYFISKQSGVDNIWMVPVKGGQPTQITKFTDNGVVRAIHLLNHPHLLYMRATSANGDYHIYKIKDDGSDEAEDLTPTGAGVNNELAGISYNGRYVYFRSNKTNHDKVDLWRYDAQQYSTENVFPNDKDYQILAWSRDHGRLLAMTPSNGALTMIDIVSTEHTPLVTPTSPYKTAMWDPMNHDLFFIDANGDLKATEVSSGATRDLMKGVSSFDFSPNGKYTIVKDAQGWQVFEAATNTALALPAGFVPAAIAPQENKLLYTLGGKLYLYDIGKKSSTELATIN